MAHPKSVSYKLIDASGIVLGEHASIMEAIATIDKTDARIALVVDSNGKLIGSATDGDIRRGLLRGESLEAPIRSIMHTSPHALPLKTPRERILGLMESAGIRQIPLLTEAGRIAGIVTYDDLLGFYHEPRPNPVVIMAGGKGKRLLPITTDIPKPMVTVGNKPILEWIIKRFLHQGFHEFHLAVNYLGHMIEQYFGDGERFGCRINYIREKEFLGTAGALSLLPSMPKHPVIVTNGDILASVDFGDVVDFHAVSNATATVCARAHQIEVPYGVLQVKDGCLASIIEKPVYEDLISAGMYVLTPEVLATIPKGVNTDMPSVLTNLIKDDRRVAVYALQEEWMDIGRHDDLEQAKKQYLAQLKVS